jgi:hypothetical protein
MGHRAPGDPCAATLRDNGNPSGIAVRKDARDLCRRRRLQQQVAVQIMLIDARSKGGEVIAQPGVSAPDHRD